ncbi:uncharacterized protein LOC142354344 [Convolutriloba macropyga]|uniref:uncharacterized protein LOC142354344 n=1 Tax=Convolutriloba macropyga TaxID=536237 RepID=UPI003F523AC6
MASLAKFTSAVFIFAVAQASIQPNDENAISSNNESFNNTVRRAAKAVGFEAYNILEDTRRDCNKIHAVVQLIESETNDASSEIGSDSSAAKRESIIQFGYIILQVNNLYDFVAVCNTTLGNCFLPPIHTLLK